ncbi:hypothetical protein C1H46_037183 [Malus baccata]|uniref:60S acidic ribosomal protein P2 n=1 Tax=Malus baccata TaxID=106549 RepID=A0A540KSU5_MALBA|nr:hypothetical protein C1H46_037183 [Malus baccata]
MKVIAAYLLAVLGGKNTPSAKDLKDILASVGAEADDDRIQLLFSEIEGHGLESLRLEWSESLHPGKTVFLIRVK